MLLFDYFCYDAAVATDEDVPPSIRAVLLVLAVEVGESVELFVAAEAFFTHDGTSVAFRAGLIASSEKNNKHFIVNYEEYFCMLRNTRL